MIRPASLKRLQHLPVSLSLLGIILLSGMIPVCAVESLSLPYSRTDHGIYQYLDRLETAGEMPLISRTRPYLSLIRHVVPVRESATHTREYRRYAGESMAGMYGIGRSTNPARESGWRNLRRWLGIRDESAEWLYGSGFHFASWTYDTTLAVTVQPVYGYEVFDTDDERGNISRFTGGIRVEGGYAGRLRFLMDFRDHTESGNGPYDSRSNLYEDRWAAVELKGNSSTSYDISESFLQYYGRDLSVTAGRGRHRWGPAQFGSLFLNSYAPPFDYVRFDAAIESKRHARAVYYTFLHGWLESNLPADSLYQLPDGRPRTLNAEEFLSAQRLEIRPRGNLLLGFSQGVIYGDRGVQLGYVTPLNFLYSVQHSNDDKDNLLLAFDGTWRPVHGLKLYGELLLDDVLVDDLFRSTGNNKSAFTVGAQGLIPQSFWRHFDATLEYTKIRPFVYSHFFTVNTYTHWTSPLGYTLEPNSEFIHAYLRGTFYPVQITLSVSRQNHGADPLGGVVGGDIYHPNYEGNANEFPFLAGDFERTIRIGFEVLWEALPGLNLCGGVTAIRETREEERLETSVGFGWNL